MDQKKRQNADKLTEEEEAFVQGIELALDWQLDISEGEIIRYRQLVEKREMQK